MNRFEATQKKVLKSIVNSQGNCNYLQQNGLRSSENWSKIPICSYDSIEDLINDIRNKSGNSLTKSEIVGFSKSSGTTSPSKFIPVTARFMRQHYWGGFDMLSLYYHSYPKSQILGGKNFSLTGTYTIENGFVVGDISALITYFLPSIFKQFRTPPLDIATIADWETKIDRLLPILSKADIRWMAGVPSWIAIIIDRLESYRKKSIREIWPNFEVFFYGGTSIKPFEKSLESKFNQKIVFWQIYNASEGFLGVQYTKNEDWLTILPHRDSYFEFIDSRQESSLPVSSQYLSIDRTYELILSNRSGLYRYQLGDLVKIKSLNPLMIELIGRTKNCINTFGEELMIHNVEKALEILSKKISFSINDFTIAPVLEGNSGYHRWYIEFENEPEDLILFENQLDALLQTINSDYHAKRYKDMVLSPLKVVILQKQTFFLWLKSKNRVNVQSKIPKLTECLSFQKELDEILSS